MSEENKPVRYDLSGYETITSALMDLINQYPALDDGDEIEFSVLNESAGKAIFPISGAVIESEKISITGRVVQQCIYPFMVVYRATAPSEAKRIQIKQWLDDLGKWLERQPITIDGVEHKLSGYPELQNNQSFDSISRQTPGYLESINEDRSEDWQIHISAKYKNIYKRQSI